MNIALYSDNTLGLQIESLVDCLNSQCETIRFHKGDAIIRFPESKIVHPNTYKKLDKETRNEMKGYDMALIGTAIRYDNNYFFEGYKNRVIIAFNDWQSLTDLPISNGYAYFIASLIADEIGIGETHKENSGCLNDFWWDKTGIDTGMRAAFLCSKCQRANGNLDEQSGVIKDIEKILDLVSSASRKSEDILSSVVANNLNSYSFDNRYDVFISHNSKDKPEIRAIVELLKKEQIKTWFDEEELEPGFPWQPQLEKQIGEISAAAVFVGSTGLGAWEDVEMRAFLNEFMNRKCPVIPVILPTANDVPVLPIFLRQMMWIDMREDQDLAMQRLINTLGRVDK